MLKLTIRVISSVRIDLPLVYKVAKHKNLGRDKWTKSVIEQIFSCHDKENERENVQ